MTPGFSKWFRASGILSTMLVRLLAAALAASSLLAVLPVPAHAAAVKTWGPVDGVGAAPLANGSALLDVRAAAFIPGTTHALSQIGLLAGASEWLEIGAVVGAGFQGVTGPSPGAVSLDIFPWAKAALPLANETVKTGVLLGGALSGYASSTETTPGVTALLDLNLGPALASLNAGYARRLTTGVDVAAANLNFTVPAGQTTFYEEQFATYPVGEFTRAGIRGAVIFPLGPRLAVDGSLAALYTNSPREPAWSLSPGIGVSAAF